MFITFVCWLAYMILAWYIFVRKLRGTLAMDIDL